MSWAPNVCQSGLVENKVLEFNLFLALSAAGLVFTEILLWLFSDVLGLYYLILKVIAVIMVMFLNFISRQGHVLCKGFHVRGENAFRIGLLCRFFVILLYVARWFLWF